MKHFLLMRFGWLRDRLRCPRCGKVGTWKPHGGYWAWKKHGDRRAKRWLCKWCGHYVGPEGVRQAVVADEPFWQLQDDIEEEGTTPSDVMAEYLIDPWKG